MWPTLPFVWVWDSGAEVGRLVAKNLTYRTFKVCALTLWRDDGFKCVLRELDDNEWEAGMNTMNGSPAVCSLNTD